MEITYAGRASFTIQGERRVILNPQTPGGADLALYSTRQRSARLIANGPGEYEIGGVMVATAEIRRDARRALAHAVTFDDLTVAFVPLNPNQFEARALEQFGRVDVLLVAADEVRAVQAAVATFSPRVTIPFGERAQEVAAAMGVQDVQLESRFTWNGTAATPKVRLLKPRTGKRHAA